MIIKKRNILPLILLLGFILGSEHGFVALWKNGNTDPIRIYPYSTASLPDADREALEEGIPVERPEDLIILLEDYLS